jgi:20S proteasome subunit beta 2
MHSLMTAGSTHQRNAASFISTMHVKMMSFFFIVSCALFIRAISAEKSPFDNILGSPSSLHNKVSSRQRRSLRANIISHDAAISLDDMDLDDDLLKNKSTESIMRESLPNTRLNDESNNAKQKPWSLLPSLQLALSTENSYYQEMNNPSPSLHSTLVSKKSFRSTGTTIVGCLVEGGKFVILGADTRATDDEMVADKRCEKIHCIAPNVWCCGAGTSADLEATTRLVQYSMALESLQESSIGNSNYVYNNNNNNTTIIHDEKGGILLQPVCVSAACRLLRNICYQGGGSLGVNLILGGYDVQCNNSTGRLVAIHPHGSMDVVPYSALGSGGLAAMAVLESRYSPNLTRSEGIELVKQAVVAGIENDLGSGSQVDLCVLGPGGSVDYQQGVVPEQTLDSTTTNHDASMDESILDNHNGNSNANDTESKGVNGFGNLPFAINSRRVIASNTDETTRIAKWDSLLGLD